METKNHGTQRKIIMSLTSFVLGIIGICITLFSAGSLGIVGLICGLTGIVFGVLGFKKQPEKRKWSRRGILLSVISAALGIVLFVVCSSIANSGVYL